MSTMTWYFTTALAAQTARFAGQLFVKNAVGTVASMNHCSSSLVVLVNGTETSVNVSTILCTYV